MYCKTQQGQPCVISFVSCEESFLRDLYFYSVCLLEFILQFSSFTHVQLNVFSAVTSLLFMYFSCRQRLSKKSAGTVCLGSSGAFVCLPAGLGLDPTWRWGHLCSRAKQSQRETSPGPHSIYGYVSLSGPGTTSFSGNIMFQTEGAPRSAKTSARTV